MTSPDQTMHFDQNTGFDQNRHARISTDQNTNFDQNFDHTNWNGQHNIDLSQKINTLSINTPIEKPRVNQEPPSKKGLGTIHYHNLLFPNLILGKLKIRHLLKKSTRKCHFFQ